MNLTSPKDIKELLERHDFQFRKRFGQNFLLDSNIVSKIADSAGLNEDDTVIEIGPGIGTLTQELAKRAHKVIAIEIDRDLIPILDETLADFNNIEIINEDVLKVNLNDLVENGKGLKISANLPYYITTPIIMSLLESDLPIDNMSFLIQKEVADRIAAKPGSKTYGSLSVIAQYYADVTKAFDVPANVFMPKPKVDSSVVTLSKKKEIQSDVNKNDYFRVVKAAFANRRKTLLNSLGSNLGLDKAVVQEKLESIGIDPKSRPEQLSDKEFEKVTKALYE